jgi:hypothetical protein
MDFVWGLGLGLVMALLLIGRLAWVYKHDR